MWEECFIFCWPPAHSTFVHVQSELLLWLLGWFPLNTTPLASGSRDSVSQKTKRRSWRQQGKAEAWNVPSKPGTLPSSRWPQQHVKVQIPLIWASLVAFSPFPSLLRWSRPWAAVKMWPCCWLLETFVKPGATAASFNCFDLFSGATLIFTSHLCAADFPFMPN